MTMSIPRPEYDPDNFAEGPRRDKRFEVKDQWVDCLNYPEGDPRREIEFFHRQMNEEVNGMECAARTLSDFPDAEWEIRLKIARQCYDEARHVEMYRRVYLQRGGTIGQSPVMNFQYRIITNIPDLCGRLAVQNRSFEAEGIDAIEPEIDSAQTRADTMLSELYDAQLADEICHVRFANDYLATRAVQEPASVMRVGKALNYAGKAFLQVMGQHAIDSVKYTVNRNGRLDAGFTSDEVDTISTYRSSRRPATK